MEWIRVRSFTLVLIFYIAGMVIAFGYSIHRVEKEENFIPATLLWPFYISYNLFEPQEDK